MSSEQEAASSKQEAASRVYGGEAALNSQERQNDKSIMLMCIMNAGEIEHETANLHSSRS